MGRKGPVYKAYVHHDCKGSNPVLSVGQPNVSKQTVCKIHEIQKWSPLEKIVKQTWVCKLWSERENQQDATVKTFIIDTFSTCFGHHHAHLQENKTCVTARGVLRCNKRGKGRYISCNVFFVGWCVVNLDGTSCVYMQMSCAPHTRFRYTRPEKRTRQIPVQRYDKPICTRHSHIHMRIHLGLLHTTPQKRHYS